MLLAYAADSLFRRARAPGYEQVYAGVYLHDVTKFDQKDGVFDVDLELWAKWLGDFAPEKLRIANSAETDRTLLGQEHDGAWRSARWRAGALPLVLLAVMAGAMRQPASPTPLPAAKLGGDRRRSDRALLRIGTDSLATLTGHLALAREPEMVRWPAAHRR